MAGIRSVRGRLGNELVSPFASKPWRMKRSRATSEKNPGGRSRSARASMSGMEPRTAVTAFLPNAHIIRPKRLAARRNESGAKTAPRRKFRGSSRS